MSEVDVPQRRKKPKGNKSMSQSSRIRSSSKRKSKSRPSKSYQDNEYEVQQLLADANFIIDDSRSCSQDRCIDFFCKDNEYEYDTQRSQLPAALEEADQDLAQSVAASDVECNSDSEQENDEPERIANKTPSDQSSVQQAQTTVSTYIQIENEPLTQSNVYSKFITNNDSMVYMPITQLDNNFKSNIEELDLKDLNGNTKRMLSRYQEEAQAAGTKVPECVVTVLCNPQRFLKDRALYRTLCTFEFHPIFCEPSREAIEIPTRKFVTILIKELHFIEHPKLTEEHRLANKIEALYQSYTQNLNGNTCGKLQSALQIERNVVNRVLKQADNREDTMQQEHMEDLAENLMKIKRLREQLYQEETKMKQQLNEILSTWLQLKKVRKNQEFQCTRFKLGIRVEEQSDLQRATQKWNQRFETDLNEVLREELESYYRAKRNRTSKSKKPNVTKISDALKVQLAAAIYAPDEPKVEVFRCPPNEEECYQMPVERKIKCFFLKIYFDGQFVGETRNYRLEPDLRVVINEAMGVFLERRLPKQVSIFVYQKSTLGQLRKLAEVNVPMQASIFEDHSSSSSISQTQKLTCHFKRKSLIGQLLIRFQCDEEHYSRDSMRILDMSGKVDIDQTTVQEPHSVSNTKEITESSEDDSVTVPKITNVTTCTLEEDLLQFCSRSDLDSNPRFKLLRSRFLKNDARTKDLRCVPLVGKELEFDWGEQTMVEAGNWMDPIDWHKHQGKKYLRLLYETISNQCSRLSKMRENSENLLIGDAPATWSSFFNTLALLFHPRRPLNPMRQESFAVQAQTIDLDQNQNFTVHLHVVRATGIPIRNRLSGEQDNRLQRSSSSTDSVGRDTSQNFRYSNVKPFVALSYKDKLVRTMTAEGSSPTWNEQLSLQLSGTLRDLRNDIKITLFDEVVENHLNDDPSMRTMDFYQRIHCNWLGEYRIPFAAMLSQQKLEGAIEMNMPRVLVGYKRPSLDTADANIIIEQYPEIKETVRLWYFLSIQPVVQLPTLYTDCLECSERNDVRLRLFQWSLQVKELQSQRYVEPLVCTMDGKRVCITRLLEAIPLPIETSEYLLETICRFVSLINLFRSNEANIDIWLNNQIVLDTTWGSPKDLGVLLCNFLLTMKLRCWLVLGNAYSYGECAFVLYQSEEKDLMFIDPCTGRRYSTKDLFCPLTKIKLIVASDNIFCNIQNEDRVAMTNFNFNDSSCWLPAFSKKNPAPLGGVQKLDYTYRASYNTFELQNNIERKVMKKINSWRMRKTIWNRAFQNRLRNILEEVEQQSKLFKHSYGETKYLKQLNAEFPQYKINGFTLNFSYTNLASISDRIKSTGIHLINDKDVEYSLAVYIHIYPNNIFSIWIFLITVIPV